MGPRWTRQSSIGAPDGQGDQDRGACWARSPSAIILRSPVRSPISAAGRPPVPTPGHPLGNRARHRPAIALGLVVFVSTLLLYWPTTGYDFVGVDDAALVSENPMVLHGVTTGGLRRAFTGFHASNRVPITFVSLMIDSTVFGTGPRGYRFTNILLHALDATLLFLLFSRMTGHALNATRPPRWEGRALPTKQVRRDQLISE